MICVLMIAVVAALADPPPEDFVGIKWGATISEARGVLEKRDGLALDRKASSDTRLRFTGGTFAGFDVEAWEFSFGPKGLFYAAVWARDAAGGDAFRIMKQAIAEKYGGGRAQAIGSPTRHYDWIQQRWENGSATKPSPNMSWSLQTSFTRQTIQIQCRPEKKNRVHVTYIDETLAKESPKAPPAKEGQPKKADL